MPEDKLQDLFQQYPKLRSMLKFIFDTAVKDSSTRHPGGGRDRYQETPQKRHARALRVLTTQLELESADRDGLTAFAQLVAECRPEI
jgi:hypothetical protein